MTAPLHAGQRVGRIDAGSLYTEVADIVKTHCKIRDHAAPENGRKIERFGLLLVRSDYQDVSRHSKPIRAVCRRLSGCWTAYFQT